MKTRKILSAAAISAFALIIHLGDAAAGDGGGVELMKPIHGLSFDAGQKHAVAHFYPDLGRCKLVLTVAAEPNWNDPENFAANRIESTVAAGRSTRYTSDGHAFEFHCYEGARAMTFQRLNAVANAE